MLPPRRAVVYLQPGSVPQLRQARFCLEYCSGHGFAIAAVAPPSGQRDAVRTVLDGDADLIVAAYSARSRPADIRDLAAAAGVRVEYVRPPVLRREVGQMIAAMCARDGARAIADQLGVTTQEIRTTIARLDASRDPPASRRRGRRGQDGT